MPFNASGQSFVPLSPIPKVYPVVKESPPSYIGLTTAQCAANGNLTSKAVTSAGVLVEAATARANGIILVVPTDQNQVTFGNQDPISGQLGAQPIVAVPTITTLPEQVAQSGLPASPSGFAVPPGVAIHVSPFIDPMYAITPTGVAATIYFYDPPAGVPI